MDRPPAVWKRRVATLLAEPTVRFFVVGALLFVAHRIVVGNPRVVVVTPGVRAELGRRFRDHNDRAPAPAELDAEVNTWRRDEALYREALRDHLDRDDATIRTVLADRVRARAALAVPKREPSAAELDAWLAAHRSQYEAPRRYDYQTVVFPRSSPTAAADLERYRHVLAQGVLASEFGRPIVGGVLTAEDLAARLGTDLAARIRALPIGGAWQRLDGPDALLLARLDHVEGGGLPAPDDLHRRLVADWSFAEQKRAVDRAVQAIVDRYRFEERR